MHGGLDLVEEIDRRIVSASGLPKAEKWDLQTILDIYTGMHNRDRAAGLRERRKQLMIESPIYQDILDEGLQKGIEKGLRQGLEQGRAEGEAAGIRKGKLDAAKAMLARGIDMDTVVEITGLDRESIQQ